MHALVLMSKYWPAVQLLMQSVLQSKCVMFSHSVIKLSHDVRLAHTGIVTLVHSVSQLQEASATFVLPLRILYKFTIIPIQFLSDFFLHVCKEVHVPYSTTQSNRKMLI